MKRKFVLFFTSTLLLFQSSALPLLAACQNPGASGCLSWPGTTMCNSGINAGKCCALASDCPSSTGSGGYTGPTVPVSKWYSPTIGEFILKVGSSPDQEIFGERYTFAQVVWIIHSFTYLIQGDILAPEVQEALKQIFSSLEKNEPIAMSNFGTLGMPGLLIGSIGEIYRHPVGSGIQYIAQGLQKFNIATPVMAQGYGYNNNTIVQPIWTASRNVTYFLMVILLIAAGFMIMFRVKVNAQTAVSIQVMIPKIIITLILITFSYAIAGLLVDLTYLALTLMLSMLSTAGVINDLGSSVQFFTGGFYKIFLFYLLQWMFLLLVSVVATVIPAVGAWAVLLTLIIAIVLIWLLFKVFWMLLQTYISIMIGFIMAPWQILLGLIPGGGGGFGPWLRNMVANLAVFVMVPLMFLLAAYLSAPITEMLQQAQDSGIDALAIALQAFRDFDPMGLAPKPSGANTAISLPFFGFGSTISPLHGFIASLGILALIPKSAQMVKDALKASTFKYGSAFGEAITGPRDFLSSDRVTGPDAIWRRPAEAVGLDSRAINKGLLRAHSALDTTAELTGNKKGS